MPSFQHIAKIAGTVTAAATSVIAYQRYTVKPEKPLPKQFRHIVLPAVGMENHYNLVTGSCSTRPIERFGPTVQVRQIKQVHNRPSSVQASLSHAQETHPSDQSTQNDVKSASSPEQHVPEHVPTARSSNSTLTKKTTPQPVRLYAGGISAYIRAGWDISQSNAPNVMLVVGTAIKKTEFSGEQFHPHPTQHGSLGLLALIRNFLMKQNIFKQESPTDWSFDSLTLPKIGFDRESWDTVKNVYMPYGLKYLSYKIGFRNDDQRLVQDIQYTKSVVQKLERAVQDAGINQTLIYPTGRFYFFVGEHADTDFNHKVSHWTSSNISNRPMTSEEINRRYLFNFNDGHFDNHLIKGLHLPEDGRIGNIFDALHQYILKKQGRVIRGNITHLNMDGPRLHSVTIQTGKKSQTIPVETAYLSLGHTNFEGDSFIIPQDTPASGVSIDYTLSMPRDMVMKKLGLDDEGFRLFLLEPSNYILPHADANNLHNTFKGCHYRQDSDDIVFKFRATEGAYLNSYRADPLVLKNMLFKLSHQLDEKGRVKIENMTIRSCTRMSRPENMPQLEQAGTNLIISHSSAGVGNSSSGMTFEPNPVVRS